MVSEGNDIALLSIGPIGNIAQKAVQEACPKGVSVAHFDMIFLKPIDEALLHQIARTYKKIVVLEEGTKKGGLSSTVVEFMADNGYTPRIKRMGIPDTFIEQGTVKEQYALCGIDEASILEALLHFD